MIACICDKAVCYSLHGLFYLLMTLQTAWIQIRPDKQVDPYVDPSYLAHYFIYIFLFSSNFNCRLKSSQRFEYRKQRGSRSGPTNKSILTWIRAVWHIILYIFFLFSSNFNCRLKSSQRLEYHIKLLRMQRVNSGYFT